MFKPMILSRLKRMRYEILKIYANKSYIILKLANEVECRTVNMKCDNLETKGKLNLLSGLMCESLKVSK